MRAALGGDQGMNFVDDDRVDGAQGLSGLRCEEQEQRFGRGDEDVGRVAAEKGAFPIRLFFLFKLINWFIPLKLIMFFLF